MAPTDPEAYEARLRSLFGGGAETVIALMSERICKTTGRRPSPGTIGIRKCLEFLRKTAEAGGPK